MASSFETVVENDRAVGPMFPNGEELLEKASAATNTVAANTSAPARARLDGARCGPAGRGGGWLSTAP